MGSFDAACPRIHEHARRRCGAFRSSRGWLDFQDGAVGFVGEEIDQAVWALPDISNALVQLRQHGLPLQLPHLVVEHHPLHAAGSSRSAALHAAETPAKDKVKVLYHVDGKDLEVAKYAMALINKHIDAEGGPDKIDVELVVHGPALELFDKDKMDPELKKRFEQIVEKGVHAEMCQVSMKMYNKTLDNLVKGFVATLHPVAVKRIADLQKEGYIYIKP